MTPSCFILYIVSYDLGGSWYSLSPLIQGKSQNVYFSQMLQIPRSLMIKVFGILCETSNFLTKLNSPKSYKIHNDKGKGP